MRYEHIVQKPDYKTRITVELFVETYASTNAVYRIVDVSVCPKGKRKYRSLFSEFKNSLDYWNNRNNEEQIAVLLKKRLSEYVSEEELNRAVANAHAQIVKMLSPRSYEFRVR